MYLNYDPRFRILTDLQRESSATINGAPKPYTTSGKQATILEFDCRGLEFVEFIPDGDWLATGVESGTPFTEIDMTDEWFDYDEKAKEEVSIKEQKWEIKRG